MDSYQVPLDSSFALERLENYLLLTSQHDALHQHISQIYAASIPATANMPPVSPNRSRTGSISSSSSEDNSFVTLVPPRARHHRRSEQQSRCSTTFARSSSLPTVVDESIIGEIQSSDIKIRDVNLAIKSTLTELLNNPSVRNDCQYRSWVQSRLMDAERELRGSRRRRSD